MKSLSTRPVSQVESASVWSHLPHALAESHVRSMSTGRSHPMVFQCQDEDGTELVEYVVKMRGSVDSGIKGLARELVACLLARYFGITTPQPGIVEIEAGLAAAIPHHDAREIAEKSIGPNFGTRHLGPGFTTYPVDLGLKDGQLNAAAEIFAFDALIQNPDRRRDNPNLLCPNGKLVCYDHELALAFSMIIGPPVDPCRLEDHDFVRQHVFRRQLKNQQFNLNPFTAKLAGCADGVIDTILSKVPEEWRTDELDKIADHLVTASENAQKFISAVIKEVHR